MVHTYRAVGWNRQKRVYDLTLLAGIALYAIVFTSVSLILRPQITAETLLIRMTATLAFLLLSLTLSIGPLTRLSPHFLPLLYNRRHLGVTTFLVALVHAVLALVQFHSLGDLSPFVSLLVSNGSYSNLAFFPFQILGLLALVILFLMAATSHDFWLEVLTPVVWKSLHMCVYLAYLLLIGHVALGTLQAETHPGLAAMLAASVIWVAGLHIVAGLRDRSLDRRHHKADGWTDAGVPDSITDARARVVRVDGERVAVFRDGDRLYALGNVCAHQGGPLGEGRVRDGCAVCPWHGYEYRLESGKSPPPFEERVPVYDLRLRQGRLQVRSLSSVDGDTSRSVAVGVDANETQKSEPFYVGYQSSAPGSVARQVRRSVLVLFVIAGLVAAASAAWQQPFSSATFEYGVDTTLRGRLLLQPLPHLMVDPAAAEHVGTWLLVRPGKHGFGDLGEDGRSVAATGSLIRHPLGQMIEVHAIEDSSTRHHESVPPLIDLGSVALDGEIVDAKCWLGVMKPGRKKAHRACASLCIRGGIPPVLLTQIDGRPAAPVLVSDAGASVGSHLLDRVAEPVQVEGRLLQRGQQLFLRIDEGDIQRLHPPKIR